MDKEVKKQSCYHSLDFKSAKARLNAEPFVVDEYKVELEDYENINDLIKRSIRTKTKFKPESDPNAIYDSDEDIAAQILPEIIDQQAQPDIELDPVSSEAKQSDGKEETSSSEAGSEPVL